MKFSVRFLEESHPLLAETWRFGKDKLVARCLNGEQIIDNNVDWLELFKIFKNINAVLCEKIEKVRIDTINRKLLTFFTLLHRLALEVLFIVSDDAQRRYIPTISELTLDHIVRSQCPLHKYYFFL